MLREAVAHERVGGVTEVARIISFSVYFKFFDLLKIRENMKTPITDNEII